MQLELGGRIYQLGSRALVMGILNRTPDSFYDKGATWDVGAFYRRAEELVAQGADILDVGGVKAGPGPEVSEAEELDRVIPAIEGLVSRFDLPVSVDTWRAAVAAAAFRAGAAIGNDISGFADPDYLSVAGRAGAAVVATHIRLAPRVPDPEPVYRDLVSDVVEFLSDCVDRALAAGVKRTSIVVDAGLDLGKTAEQSRQLLLASDVIAHRLDLPVLLSASNKTFLGKLLDLEIGERGAATTSAHAIGVVLGCRILRAHDVRAAVRVRNAVGALIEAEMASRGAL